MEQYETRISKENIDRIVNWNMTPAQIIQFLEDGATYRTFADVLRSVYPGADLQARLRKGMIAIAGIPAVGKEAESMDRNIRNWLRGSSTPQNREQLFKICFSLGLREAAASKVLASASDMGIHYRNPRELVYAFSLRTGRSYAEAVTLNEQMEGIYGPKVAAAAELQRQRWAQWEKDYHEKRKSASEKYRKDRERDVFGEGWIGAQMEETVPNFMTQQVSYSFDAISTQEELARFFHENSSELGVIHESAYEKFRRLLLTLEEPDDPMASSAYDAPIQKKEKAKSDSDRRISDMISRRKSADQSHQESAERKVQSDSYALDKVADLYLRMNVPMGKNTKNYDYLQKAIKKNWPGSSDLQRMKARTIDVDRKTLLLLFIATEDYLYSKDLQYSEQADQDAAQYVAFETDTQKDELEITISKLNLFLDIYGMNQLDPGNPFDCLVLYAIAAEYGDGFLGDPFSEALGVLFQDV